MGRIVQIRWQNPGNPRETLFVAEHRFTNPDLIMPWIHEILHERSGEMPEGWEILIRSEGQERFELLH